jgi:hypothetical protein
MVKKVRMELKEDVHDFCKHTKLCTICHYNRKYAPINHVSNLTVYYSIAVASSNQPCIHVEKLDPKRKQWQNFTLMHCQTYMILNWVIVEQLTIIYQPLVHVKVCNHHVTYSSDSDFLSTGTSGSKISKQPTNDTAGRWNEIDKTPNAEWFIRNKGLAVVTDDSPDILQCLCLQITSFYFAFSHQICTYAECRQLENIPQIPEMD